MRAGDLAATPGYQRVVAAGWLWYSLCEQVSLVCASCLDAVRGCVLANSPSFSTVVAAPCACCCCVPCSGAWSRHHCSLTGSSTAVTPVTPAHVQR